LKHERATEEVRELAALYALSSLTQHEAHSFEIHIEDCPVCKSELSRLEHAVAGIGLTAEEVETPEYLRDLLVARVERDPQVSVSTPLPESDEKTPERNIAPPVFASLAHSTKPKSRRFTQFLIVIFIAFMVSTFWNFMKFGSMRTQNAQLQTQLSASKIEADNLRKESESQNKKPSDFEQILKLMGKAGMRTVWLVGQPSAPSATGALWRDTQQHRYLLMGSFPPAPQGKTYQLWLVTPTKKVSAGLLKASPDGTTSVVAPIPEDSSEATAAGITLEPESGSSMPTTRFSAFGRFN
jgi:hypothetical protein